MNYNTYPDYIVKSVSEFVNSCGFSNDAKELNLFEKQLEEIIEEQRNVNNPGYFTGSGKASLFSRNFFKSPIIMLIVGIIFSIPMIYDLICNFSIYIIYNNLFSILISTILITGGILRLKK